MLLSDINAQTALINGRVTNQESGFASVFLQIRVKEDPKIITQTDTSGTYSLEVPAGREITLIFFGVEYKEQSLAVFLNNGEVKKIDISVINKSDLNIVVVEANRTDESYSMSPQLTNYIPSGTGGDIGSLLKGMIGVTSNNELSTGYNVRGGNFDENLVYVNDIEVYRPFLARSGQSEGLSFANSDMVSKIQFSPGGFAARYGDKLSSVLDITYRKPKSFAVSSFASLMGGNIVAEGKTKNLLLSWMMGARYKTNQYLLNTLDVQGDYRPKFFDYQAHLNFDFTKKFQLEYLGNIAINDYLVYPSTRETRFGTINQAYSFKVYFDGHEESKFQTLFNALSATFKPLNGIKRDSLRLKFILSAYTTSEQEHYTTMGQYFIDQLETDFGSANFGNVAFNRGIGTFINNGRNDLFASVVNFEHKGRWLKPFKNGNIKDEFSWGARVQHEEITDKLSEYKYLDSAGYSVPQGNTNTIEMSEVVKSRNFIATNRIMGYSQYLWNKQFKDTSDFVITAGIRTNYWTFNNQNVISPRVTMAYKPYWKKDIVFKASWGYYYQPPFYREFRNFTGQLNYSIKAQESVHYMLTTDYNLKLWNRPFKIIFATYFKQLNNLIPYEIDNVRIRYFAKNNSTGYATGIDLRINGEFVKNSESWASISVMQTKENIKDDYYYTYKDSTGNTWYPNYSVTKKTDSTIHFPGFIPRPTDQRVTFTIFFQDYLPKLPSFKVHMLMSYGTPLPFGPPMHDRYKDTLRMPPYKRVDIGFSYMIKSEEKQFSKRHPLNWLKSAWISLEVLNLIAAQNTVSYLWVKDVSNRTYAIPNYLTNRQLNLKLQLKF